MISIENFTDKYVPLIAQNITCDTLTQIISHRERKKLEIYELKVYKNLHKVILNDKGIPNLEKNKNNLLMQINNKLTFIQQIIDERKLLVKKDPRVIRSKSTISGAKKKKVNESGSPENNKLQRHAEAEEKIK